MIIRYEMQFKKSLREISLYIAKDKPTASENFNKDLKVKIEEMAENPRMYRASYYFDNENYRDLTFKGYTTIYKIDSEKDVISILDIFKWVKW